SFGCRIDKPPDAPECQLRTLRNGPKHSTAITRASPALGATTRSDGIALVACAATVPRFNRIRRWLPAGAIAGMLRAPLSDRGVLGGSNADHRAIDHAQGLPAPAAVRRAVVHSGLHRS